MRSLTEARRVIQCWHEILGGDMRYDAAHWAIYAVYKREKLLSYWLPIVKADHSMIPFMRDDLMAAYEDGELARTLLWLLRGKGGV